tara:strand:- start:203 stop:610 length:408 start_codon:yes stop_codon:yes gene_type:complete
MVQRKQTLFILLSLVLICLIIFLIDLVKSEQCAFALKTSESSPLNMFFYGSFLLGFISIFLYKNRLLQYRLCLLNMYFQICPIIYICSYISMKSCMPQFSEMIGFYLIFLIFICYGLAAIYIKKDNDLIKSIDRI